MLASAIVSVGDTDALIKTAANRFFAKPEPDQISTLTDLLSSSGRRAINLLTHDQLFSAKTAPRARFRRRRPSNVGGDSLDCAGFVASVDGRAAGDGGRRRSARGDHPQGVLARAHRSRARSSTRSTSRSCSRKSPRRVVASRRPRRRRTRTSSQRSRRVARRKRSSRPSGRSRTSSASSSRRRRRTRR